MTDVLLVLNAVVYIAQLATKQRLTAWGIKAIIPPAHLPAVDCLHSINMRVTLRPQTLQLPILLSLAVRCNGLCLFLVPSWKQFPGSSTCAG